MLSARIEFLNKLKNAPTEYFEAKAQRAVSLNEFTAAVVPEGTDKQTINLLKKNGISDIRYYKKGDNADRARAVQSNDQIFFSTSDLKQGKDSATMGSKENQNDLRNTEQRGAPESKQQIRKEKRLREAFSRAGWENTDTIKTVKPETNAQKALRQIGKIFNQDVILWRSTDDGLNIINGVVWPWRDGEIHINDARSEYHMMNVVGHEVAHTLQNNHPDLYEFLKNEIYESSSGFQRFLWWLCRSPRRHTRHRPLHRRPSRRWKQGDTRCKLK